MTGLLLRPSVLSACLSLLAGVIILGVANGSDVLKTFFFYDYFFGSDGLVTQLQPRSGDESVIDAFFGSSLTFNVIIIGVALLLGIGTYALLALWGRAGSTTTMQELRAADGVSRSAMRMEFQRRLKIRLIVGIIWFIYFQISIKVLLPFCILASQVGIKALWDASGILYIVFALVLFATAVHVHVILLRLFALKPRVFGSKEAMLTQHY
jgi:NADH:ubiquinone oxidoreductase subunit 3 (subunit A)